MTKEFKLYRKKLHFKFKAGTSRGYYTTRDCYFLTIEKNGVITAIGECSPLPGLSAEYTDKQSFESKLEAFVARANYDKNFSLSTLKHESSILFAFESVLLHEDRKSLLLFNNGFTQGKVPIKINGLIWMGDYETMRQRIISKVNSGFKCIKVKIGAIDFIKELELLKLIRSEFSDKDLTLRVDANGAFFPENALNKLEALAKYDIHSIEQPIKAGQYEVSEKGFATKDAGVAVIPATDTKEMSGAEIAKWEKLPKGQQMMDAFKQGPAPEKTITQEMRQEEFDRYQTTDDHGMHIIGKAKDQNGTPYFIVKNSWNKYNKFGGYFYASYPYMALKTMDIMVHKNAIPKAIRKKLGMN